MNKLEKLVNKLKELFQLDQPDLDFGFYKVMHQKSKDVDEYLNKTLPETVKDAFATGKATGSSLKEKLEEAKKACLGALGADSIDSNGDVLEKYEALPASQAYMTAKEEFVKNGNDSDDQENEIYGHLLKFFSRYYDGGDFMSKRRYKGDTYAIPYAGEEVMLHWANKDQYYIKSGESFSNYSFKLSDDRRVNFKLLSADVAKDNQKQGDKERRFVLVEEKTATKIDEDGEEYDETLVPVKEMDGELFIYFEYKPMPKKSKQKDLNAEALDVLLSSASIKGAWSELDTLQPTEKNKNRTLLEKHLNDYTGKNSADYFIHKDLGKFLRNELDFYIKNEVMHLDDVANAETFAQIEKSLKLIQVLRQIALDLVDFLAQLEDFQKKLWLKKKFVVATNYCITLDRVPEELYSEIVDNQAQWDEWEKLGFIVEDTGDDMFSKKPKTEEYLKQFQNLVLDTKFFDSRFKYTLLNSIDNFDEQCDGLLIHSENFQALNLLQERYKEQVKCVYIDPPFNLGQNGDFLYKTDYKDSTWNALLFDRLLLGKSLLKNNGISYTRCDYNGNFLVRSLIDDIFGVDGFKYELLVQRIRKNVTKQGKISLPLANDSLFMAFKTEESILANPYLKLKEIRQAYWRRMDDSAGFRNPPEREIFGEIFVPYKHDAHFKYSQKSINSMIMEGRIKLDCKNKKCKYEHLDGAWIKCPKCGSIEATPKYRVEATDQKILDTNWLDIAGYSSTTGFSTENSEVLLQRAINVASYENDLIMDFFAGSGTTLAVAQKNGRKWLGVEMEEQFNTHILPRLKRVVSKKSDERKTDKGNCFKYFKLESYEDTLNNLKISRSDDQELSFDAMPDDVKKDYLLHYMLEEESKSSLLSVDAFRKPFDYQLDIATDSAGATVPTKIDLVETFNYLIGLKVKSYDANLDRGFIIVEGETLKGEKTLIIWRDMDKVGYDELTKLCKKYDINPKDLEYDVVYVNGDHHLPNINTQAEMDGAEVTLASKVRSIEDEFLTRMFEVGDV